MSYLYLYLVGFKFAFLYIFNLTSKGHALHPSKLSFHIKEAKNAFLFHVKMQRHSINSVMYYQGYSRTFKLMEIQIQIQSEIQKIRIVFLKINQYCFQNVNIIVFIIH